ncbi:Predicted Zn-dependent peptidase [Polaribacter sp. KT25b]|uniref:M16 family metallopeptidase n=1 Tax=Polaribacter sp. KT25b TaxID=1855336 RepID=UPI000879F990|nr:pitrilysin family protein [Polaribacter sp. KT25b]SDR79948.1 Predicted Zn-dependent peptidase [Polaribacter sp. KT25b]
MKSLFKIVIFFIPLFICAQKMNNVHLEEYDLANGLHVILHKDVNEPNVIVGTKYHVGSKNEEVGKTGYAHFYEHLLFHGTKNIPQGKFEKIILDAGGYCNAYTSYDVTYYYQLLPAHEFKLGLWAESERMLHPVITPEGINREREIVKEEKRMRYDNKPLGNSYFEMMSKMFSDETYGHNMIGSMNDLNVASKEDFDAFLKTYYIPNNACLVVSGNIDIKETKKWIKLYFKDIPKGKKIKRPKNFDRISGLEKHTERTVKGLKNESILIGYPLMSQSNSDASTMQIISAILSGDRDYSYFENHLNIEKDTIIKRINASADFWEKIGTLRITATVKNKNSESYLQEKIEEQLTLLKNEPVNPVLLQQVKKQFEAIYVDYFYHAETFADKVTSFYHLYNKTSDIKNLIENINKVTSKDIQRVAKKYLDKKNQVVIVYHPE